MAVTKSKKAVQEYDPLSWLKEDDKDAPAIAADTAPVKKAIPKKATPKKVASKKKAANKTAVEKVNTKKIAEEKPQKAVQTESADDLIEGTNFGFFGDDEQAQAETLVSDNDLLVLDSELTIKNIANFKHLIDDHLSQHAEIRLDASGLQKIDTAGLQLLFSLQKSLRNSGRQIEWAHQSDVIVSATKIVGMEALLESDMASIEQDQGFGFF